MVKIIIDLAYRLESFQATEQEGPRGGTQHEAELKS